MSSSIYIQFCSHQDLIKVVITFVNESDSINTGVGKAPTIDASSTDGLATEEGSSWELRGEGPCQAPSLTCSNTVSQACKNYSPRGS